ncbi:hypothetical protein [Actinoplanes regularis]|uniref:PAP2 superfamily protein n=1 Tax=Actinoplanes regularis TaxID=52697 RepID=A0A238XI02_9ACTN|nr:hypothetical protein [Actinoplanes regularis]GIE86823.1 hypothetical protein Are01nite_33030 [Actinoplanes regularis]SNR58191.1 hypothetical protein SAMN06264365_103449 [Actinoplanes regularis]
MTVTARLSNASHRHLAAAVTDHLQPRNWIIATALLGGAASAGTRGLIWGAYSMVFAAIIPLLLIRAGTRTGRYADRHLHPRAHRLTIGTAICASVGLGITLMTTAGAPRTVIAITAAMLTTLAALMLVTTAWKISIHSAVAAGATALLIATCGPTAILAVPLAAAVAWSRIALRHHTRAQAVAGIALGALVATATFLGVA